MYSLFLLLVFSPFTDEGHLKLGYSPPMIASYHHGLLCVADHISVGE